MAVMYLGRIVEIGSSDDVCEAPAHPYTKALLSAVPTTDPRARGRKLDLKGEISVGSGMTNACRFMPRCPYAFEKCAREPDLIRVGKQHYAACYLAEPS
jgi:oligopeptide/dipeptide ABC transporter ATP-binding protein